jgi:hypothetical protein
MKTILFALFFALPAFNSYSQDSTTYYKILNNTQWFYIDTEDESDRDYYFIWNKRDLKELVFDILNKNGINRLQRVNRRDQIGIRDLLLEIKIDTSAFLMSFDYFINSSILQKMRIITIELNLKKPVYFTGVENLYLANIGRKYIKPFVIQLPLYEQSAMDQIIFGIEDLVYSFIRDYNRAKKL